MMFITWKVNPATRNKGFKAFCLPFFAHLLNKCLVILVKLCFQLCKADKKCRSAILQYLELNMKHESMRPFHDMSYVSTPGYFSMHTVYICSWLWHVTLMVALAAQL